MKTRPLHHLAELFVSHAARERVMKLKRFLIRYFPPGEFVRRLPASFYVARASQRHHSRVRGSWRSEEETTGSAAAEARVRLHVRSRDWLSSALVLRRSSDAQSLAEEIVFNEPLIPHHRLRQFEGFITSEKWVWYMGVWQSQCLPLSSRAPGKTHSARQPSFSPEQKY